MTTSCSTKARIDAHFSGQIQPEEEAAMRTHLADCEPCRRYYERRLILAKLDPKSIPSKDRIAIGLGLQKPSQEVVPPILDAQKVRGLFSSVRTQTSAALLLAASLLFVLFSLKKNDGFTARGNLVPSAEALDGSRKLIVYRASNGQAPVPVVDSIHRDDELLFAYENSSAQKYLLIYAVDEEERIYWFHPGWTDARENPTAISIESSPGVHELKEAVAHRWKGSHIEIHATFVDAPIAVRSVEEALKQPTFQLPGAVDRVYSIRLVP